MSYNDLGCSSGVLNKYVWKKKNPKLVLPIKLEEENVILESLEKVKVLWKLNCTEMTSSLFYYFPT